MELDAHVAGVRAETLHLNDRGVRQLTDRLEALIDGPFTKLLVADGGPEDGLLAMGDIAIWHGDDIWDNPERSRRAYAIIDDLWVEPRARRAGVARALVARLVDFAADWKVDDLILEYSLSNDEAEAAWTRLGFRPTGVRAAAPLTTVKRRLAGRGKNEPGKKREGDDPE